MSAYSCPSSSQILREEDDFSVWNEIGYTPEGSFINDVTVLGLDESQSVDEDSTDTLLTKRMTIRREGCQKLSC